MAYTSRYLLNKVAKVQAIVNNNKKKGIPAKWTWKHEIEAQFDISYSTFNNYLAIYVKGELEKLELKENEKKRQQTLEFEYD